MKKITAILVREFNTIRDTITAIDRGHLGIALLVDEKRRLITTITDGDVRRAILAGVDLDEPVTRLQAFRGPRANEHVDAPVTTPKAALLELMRSRGVAQVPLLDADGAVTEIAVFSHLVGEVNLPLQAVIMAGGLGTRLRPLTEHTPKVMLPINGRPILEHVVTRLQQAGIKSVSVTTHYQSEAIVQHFGDGKDFGIEINYINENSPLGTAGGLAFLEESTRPLLVINGDILTHVDYAALYAFHREHEADLTVGVTNYALNVPYGVVVTDGSYVKQLIEKPRHSFLVNAGIYLLSPGMRAHIPKGHRFDMTDLITEGLNLRRRVISFPIREYWVDIGQHEDYKRAQQDLLRADAPSL